MTTIDLTTTDLTVLGAVALRKLAAQAGIKGAHSGRKNDLALALAEIKTSQLIAQDEAKKAAAAKKAPARRADGTLKGKCTDCGRRPITKNVIGPELCDICLSYAEWENTHQDGDDTEGHEDCPICHPELDKRYSTRNGVSRVGQEIIAKGTEVHKSATFRNLAEAQGWTVTIQTEAYEGGNTRTYATATRGDDSLSLAWVGKAYDYPNSSARVAGKDRKVRNLKEAVRLLER